MSEPLDPIDDPNWVVNPNRMNWGRRKAREAAIAEAQEAARTGVHANERTRTFLETLESVGGRETVEDFAERGNEALKDLRRNREDAAIEFSHLMSASEYPEFHHMMETGVLRTRREHRRMDHGSDTRVPLHGQPRGPDLDAPTEAEAELGEHGFHIIEE